MSAERSLQFPSKWRLALIWWALQFLLVTAFMAAMAWQADATSSNDLYGLRDTSRLWKALGDSNLWIDSLMLAAGLAVMQLLLILPVRKPRPANVRGVPVLVSLTVAGLMIGLLLSLFVILLAGYAYEIFGEIAVLQEHDRWLWICLAMGLCFWGVSTVLLLRWSVGRSHEDALNRIVHRIFQGTLIDLVATIPLDIMIRRKGGCYCASPTFFGLVVCGVVGTVALGPLVWLPLIMKRRKAWYGGRCAVCGYDMTSLAHAERCPECGTGWKRSNLGSGPAEAASMKTASDNRRRDT